MSINFVLHIKSEYHKVNGLPYFVKYYVVISAFEKNLCTKGTITYFLRVFSTSLKNKETLILYSFDCIKK